MSKYDDFNLELNKVTDNKEEINSKALTGSAWGCIVKPTLTISKAICDKTTQGKGCDPSYTKISPCNRTYKL